MFNFLGRLEASVDQHNNSHNLGGMWGYFTKSQTLQAELKMYLLFVLDWLFFLMDIKIVCAPHPCPKMVTYSFSDHHWSQHFPCWWNATVHTLPKKYTLRTDIVSWTEESNNPQLLYSNLKSQLSYSRSCVGRHSSTDRQAHFVLKSG